MEFKLHSISWNLTRRCNLKCAHCYLDASTAEDGAEGELSTKECLRTLDQIAQVNPHPFLILTGGEPLLREDLFEIAHYAACHGFTVVVGTNGTLIDLSVARHQIQGASISLDSPEPGPHDLFRGVSGAWEGAIRGAGPLLCSGDGHSGGGGLCPPQRLDRGNPRDPEESQREKMKGVAVK